MMKEVLPRREKKLNLSMKKCATGRLKHAPDMVHLGGDGEIVSLAG
jgi:hypothetical protein